MLLLLLLLALIDGPARSLRGPRAFGWLQS